MLVLAELQVSSVQENWQAMRAAAASEVTQNWQAMTRAAASEVTREGIREGKLVLRI